MSTSTSLAPTASKTVPELAPLSWTPQKGDNSPEEVSDGEATRFTKEFKLDAVRLWKSSGRPAAAVARELGLRRNHLYKWQTELAGHGEAAFPGSGKRPASDSELQRLRRENARLREERHVKKSRGVLCAGVPVRYQFIDTQRPFHRLVRLCAVLRVSGCPRNRG